jgi:DNA-binding NarL/FixJ family response regulator
MPALRRLLAGVRTGQFTDSVDRRPTGSRDTGFFSRPATLAVVREGIRYLPVVDDGTLVGRVDDPVHLSPRERDVLVLMAEGRSNAGIAHQLWVTEGTVEKHVRRILM